MSLENHNAPSHFQHRSDEALCDELEAAERRKEADLKRKSRTVTVIMAAGAVVLGGWVVSVLIQNEASHPVSAAKPIVAVRPPELPAVRKGEAEFDSFRPESQRVNQPAKSTENPPPPGKIIDTGDLDFAVQLLNFSHADEPRKPAPKEK